MRPKLSESLLELYASSQSAWDLNSIVPNLADVASQTAAVDALTAILQSPTTSSASSLPSAQAFVLRALAHFRLYNYATEFYQPVLRQFLLQDIDRLPKDVQLAQEFISTSSPAALYSEAWKDYLELAASVFSPSTLDNYPSVKIAIDNFSYLLLRQSPLLFCADSKEAFRSIREGDTSPLLMLQILKLHLDYLVRRPQEVAKVFAQELITEFKLASEGELDITELIVILDILIILIPETVQYLQFERQLTEVLFIFTRCICHMDSSELNPSLVENSNTVGDSTTSKTVSPDLWRPTSYIFNILYGLFPDQFILFLRSPSTFLRHPENREEPPSNYNASLFRLRAFRLLEKHRFHLALMSQDEDEDEEVDLVPGEEKEWWSGMEAVEVRARCESMWDTRVMDDLRDRSRMAWVGLNEDEEAEETVERPENQHDRTIFNLLNTYTNLKSIPLALLDPLQSHTSQETSEEKNKLSSSTLRPPSPQISHSPSASPSSSSISPPPAIPILPILTQTILQLTASLTLELYLKRQRQLLQSTLASRALNRGGIESEFQSLSQRIKILKEREESARRELDKEKTETVRRRKRTAEMMKNLRVARMDELKGNRSSPHGSPGMASETRIKAERDKELEEARKELFELKALRETNVKQTAKLEKQEERLQLLRTALIVATDSRKWEVQVSNQRQKISELEIACAAEKAEVSRLFEIIKAKDAELANLKKELAHTALKRDVQKEEKIPFGSGGPGMKRMREEMNALRLRVRELEEAALGSESE